MLFYGRTAAVVTGFVLILHACAVLAQKTVAQHTAAQPSAAQSPGPFINLFNGRDLSGWHSWLGAREVPAMPVKLWGDWPPQIGLNEDPQGVFSVVQEDGAAAIRISGELWGALVSDQSHGNYHLQLQYKWGQKRYAPRADKPRNTGLLYHSTGDYGAFWSYWMRSAEFEIMEGRTGDFTSVDGVGGEVATVWDWDVSVPWQKYDPNGERTGVGGMIFRVAASADYEHASGQWNTLDLYALGDSASHYVNGQRVFSIDRLRDESQDAPVTLTSGRLQLQSEGAEVFFRAIRMRSIDALPDT